ncbi:MAG TPA: toxin-antitoxin system protein [Dehalococcoidia bacterium]|nr:toxin-antitoxin system protein [Dehalococcoidia bacterium]
MSTTIRINEEVRETLRELAAQEGLSMREVLQKVIHEYRRRHFFEQVNAAYAALQKNPGEWRAERDERKLLEGTLADGLDDE